MNRARFSRCNQAGYVALEFALGMGLLVLPTALVVLQIPGYLEKHNRVEAISSLVSDSCANATDAADMDSVADTIAQREVATSSSMDNAKLISVDCTSQSGSFSPGAHIQASVTVEVPAPVVPGVPINRTWTMTETHISVVPRYRGFDE